MTLLVHGTSIAVGGDGILFRGPPGTGKSDLALRLIFSEFARWPRPVLVADDQTIIAPSSDGLTLQVSCPPVITGNIEVRGLGIVQVPHAEFACLRLVIDLVALDAVSRMPDERQELRFHGLDVAHLLLFPFEASAPLKALLALERVAET